MSSALDSRQAKEHMHQWFINLPDTDLVYLPEGTNDFVDYVEAMGWAQDLTMANQRGRRRHGLRPVQVRLYEKPARNVSKRAFAGVGYHTVSLYALAKRSSYRRSGALHEAQEEEYHVAARFFPTESVFVVTVRL